MNGQNQPVPPWMQNRKPLQRPQQPVYPQQQQQQSRQPMPQQPQYPQNPYPQMQGRPPTPYGYPAGMQQQPVMQQQMQSPNPYGVPPPQTMPGGQMYPPGAGINAKQSVLPSQKKKVTLRILLGFLMVTAISAIVTAVYFYITYIR